MLDQDMPRYELPSESDLECTGTDTEGDTGNFGVESNTTVGTMAISKRSDVLPNYEPFED